MTREELEAFEADIAESFNRGEIRAPVHLSGGNADQVIDIFRDFKEGDFCFSTWRSHWHALLAGVPPEKVRAAIMAGRSISLNFPEHRFYSSAIVAGCCPIALGVAWQIKRTREKNRVWLCLGDMAALTGLSFECENYARWHNLPLVFVVEDNGKSVTTDTREAWGGSFKGEVGVGEKRYVKYDLPFPHAGAGVRVSF